jgi:hypothetical protein
MRKTRTTLIIAVAISLLAGSAVGVTAQDEATAVEFTGRLGFGSPLPIVEPFTDPRLAGEFRVSSNQDAYPGGPTIFMGGFSMHDDEGG